MNDSDPAGDTLESLFEETGEHADVYAVAVKQVIAWHLEQMPDAEQHHQEQR